MALCYMGVFRKTRPNRYRGLGCCIWATGTPFVKQGSRGPDAQALCHASTRLSRRGRQHVANHAVRRLARAGEPFVQLQIPASAGQSG